MNGLRINCCENKGCTSTTTAELTVTNFFCRSEHELCSSMFILWSSTGIIKNNPVSIIIFRVFKKHISSVLDLDTPRAQYKLFEIMEKQPENCLKA